MINEKFSIPSVGAIIARDIGGKKHILMQERNKPGRPLECGLIEIPAGKIRENENIFYALRREVKEETGLDIVEIEGEDEATVYESSWYKVVDFQPYHCSQNILGPYSIIMMAFIYRAEGELLEFSDESGNYRWMSLGDVNELVTNSPEKVFPMQVAVLKRFTQQFNK